MHINPLHLVLFPRFPIPCPHLPTLNCQPCGSNVQALNYTDYHRAVISKYCNAALNCTVFVAWDNASRILRTPKNAMNLLDKPLATILDNVQMLKTVDNCPKAFPSIQSISVNKQEPETITGDHGTRRHRTRFNRRASERHKKERHP